MDYERERRRKKRYREAMRNRIIAAVLLAGIIVGAIFIIKGCKKDDAPADEDQNQPRWTRWSRWTTSPRWTTIC